MAAGDGERWGGLPTGAVRTTRVARAARRSARVRHASAMETMERGDAERRKGSFSAPVPGAPNVGSRVLAKPSRFEHWGAHEDLPLLNHALSLATISKASSTNSQHKGHKIYTGSGHRCGVIPYSSVVWWIASWAEDEQLQGKNNLLRRGVLVLGELVWVRITQDEMR